MGAQIFSNNKKKNRDLSADHEGEITFFFRIISKNSK
jgi:hypothetical protein